MDYANIIVDVLLSDNVKLKPTQLGKNMKDILSYHLRKKYEGVCSHNGFILEGSIQIYKYSIGKIIDLSLNGDILYTVTYNAKTCNPIIGNVVKCKVGNKNKFGILAVSETIFNKKPFNILEIIVPQTISDVVDIEIGKMIHIEIVGKKFELGDKKISVIGKLYNVEKNKANKKVNKMNVDNDIKGIITAEELKEYNDYEDDAIGELDDADDADEVDDVDDEADADEVDDDVDADEDVDDDVDADEDTENVGGVIRNDGIKTHDGEVLENDVSSIDDNFSDDGSDDGSVKSSDD